MSGTGPAWTVISQVETMGIGPSGSAGSGVKVTFRTGDGDTASVFVPDAQYNPDTVKAMIAAKAATLAAVKGLTP